jgi:hypothetical protein
LTGTSFERTLKTGIERTLNKSKKEDCQMGAVLFGAVADGVGNAVGSSVGSSGQGTVAAVSEFTAIGFYLIYAATAVTLVVFLARTLHKNGQIFLEEAFEQPDLAQAVNQLLVIGFYLLNLGYALLVYQLQPSYDSLTLAFNELIVKMGVLLLSLGVIHLLNMFVFWKIRAGRERGRKVRYTPPPMPQPAAFMPPPPSVAGAGYGAAYQTAEPSTGGDPRAR